MTRVLVVEPNSSIAVTDAIDDAVAPLRLPGGPAVECVTLREGPPGIATQRDADSVAMPLLRLVQREAADPYVLASVRRRQRLVRQMGSDARYAGSWPVDLSAADTAGEAVGAHLAEAGVALQRERGADVIVPGCAGMARHPDATAAAACTVVEPSQQAVAAALAPCCLKVPSA